VSAISEQENRTVKKTVFVVGGFLALGVLCWAGRLWADPQAPQGPQAPQATPRTRIALINLTYVIKNYRKYQNFQEEIKKVFEPFQGTEGQLRKEGEELTKSLTPASPPEKQAEVERKLKEIKRKMEDNNAEAKLVLGRKSDDQMKIIYLDVVEAAQRYATAHEFDLVMHYNDAVTREDYNSAMNIARKVQTGALMPLYAAPGMDISVDVVNMLNYNLTPPTTQGATPGTPHAGGSN
jgi:Skp family chaperone for outer membrane proteins